MLTVPHPSSRAAARGRTAGRSAGRLRHGRRPAAAACWLCLLAAVLGVGGGLAHSQGGAPVIQVLESGQPLADGSWFNRAVTPVIQTSGGQAPVTVTALLDGAAFTSGTAVPAPGAHALAVTAVDAAGTQASPVNVGFTIKTTPPAFGPLTPAPGTITTATQVTVTGTVDSAVSVTVAGQAATLAGGSGGAPGVSFSAGPIALAEGANNLPLSATDAAGNTATATLSLVRDTTPPQVGISSPAAGAVVGTQAVDVVGSVSDLHLASVSVNGTAASVTGGLFRAAQVPLAEGANSLVALAVDQAGNQAQATAAVVRDTQPPSLQITSPASGTVVPGATITVSGVASDPHLARVLVGGAPAALQAAPGSGGAVVGWSLAVPLQSGNNVLAVQAVDTVGNSTSASVTVVRDSSAPQVHIVQPADGALLNAATVAVSGTVEQRNGMVVTVNGAPAAIGTDGASFTLAGVALVEGQNRLVARATDPAGNQGVHSILVTRDTVPPQLTAADPASGAQGIPVGTAFRLTFSEPMAAPAAGSWTLQTAAGTAIPAAATLSGSTLTVQPQAALPPAAALTLLVKAGLTDLAGNALGNPQTLSYTTLDTSAPPAPVVASVPAYLCAASVTLAGTAAAGSIVDVAGGAAAAETRADAATGQFTVAVLLTPASVNRLLVTATSPATHVVSAPAVVQVVQDCQAPYVVAAQVSGGAVTVSFDKPVTAASVTRAGAVTLTAAGGGPVAGAVTLSTDGRTATFTPAPPGTPLPAGVLRLDVSTAVQDLAGNALAYPYTKLFGTGTAAGTSFLAGTAIDNGVGRPLAGAQALVTSENGAAPPAPAPEQVTSGDGSFRLAVPAGTHQLSITRQGYTPVFRVVAVGDGQGASVFAPRLTPAAGGQSVGPAGGTVVGTPPGGAGAAAGGGSGAGTGGGAAAPALAIPGGALAAPAAVSLTGLDEQGLPAQLPFGWSPRGAAWLDLGGAALSGTATLTLPVEAAEGAPLVVVRLDPAVLQWRVVAAGVPVGGGAVTAALSGGGVDGGYAAVDPDTAAEAPAAPPAAVAGAVLPAAQAPAGTEVSAATLTFNPATVLPAQTSLATALYTVAAGGVASGMPLTLAVAETLTLLDGTTRKEPPYTADLVLYHSGGAGGAASGTPRSRFRLAPSQQAQQLPLSVGAEAVALRPYAGGTAQGNVLGPAGGTYTSGDGDRVDVPPGALAQATPVGLSRVAAADLPLPAPAGTTLAGALLLDLAGQPLLAPVSLTLALPAPPGNGAEGLLLEATDFGSGPVLRPVAALQAAGSAWTTAPIVASDLPWPGAREGGVYLFVQLTGPTGYLHGIVTGPGAGGGGPVLPILAAQVSGAGLGWTQATAADGSYVLPAPAGAGSTGAAAVAALDPATGNSAAASAAVPADGARVRLDLVLQAVPLAVTATVPADGATGVLPGIQPSVTFSRPIDPASVTAAAAGGGAGVQLLAGTQLVPADVTVQGATVNVAPRASLQPGTAYRLQATTAVRDLYGNTLPAAVTAGFTTQTIVLPSSFDLTRVFLVEPGAGGASGMAAVVGQAGALPAGALVFVENTTALVSTPSVTVAQDGSFTLSIQASLTDRLLLHVLVAGQNEVQAPLGPFHSADLASALVDAGGAVFSTGTGVKVSVPAGAFAALTRVRVTPHASTDPPAAPIPDGLAAVYAFGLDLSSYADGSELSGAAKALQVTIPAPAGAAASDTYLVLREVEPFGQHDWMLADLMSFDAAHGQLSTGEAAPAGGTETSRSQAARAAAAGGAVPLDQALPKKDYVSGIAFPGQYIVQKTLIPINYYIFPAGFNSDIVIIDSTLTPIVSLIDAAITRLLVVPALLMPTRLDRPATITVRDLSTGYVLYSHTFDPPAGPGPEVIPPEDLGDHKPPLPVAGSPVRFFLIDLSARPQADLDTGISFKTTGSSLQVTGQAAAAQAQAAVVLVGIEDGKAAKTTADGGGGFQLQLEITPGKHYVLGIGAIVATNEPLLVTFTRGLDPSWPGLDVRDASGASVGPQIDAAGSNAAVRISPSAGWVAGKTYTLHLGSQVADSFGDATGRDIDVPFQVESSQVLSTFPLAAARDIVRMGSELFVAADTAGLVVLDASQPGRLIDLVPGNITFPMALNDPVRGLAVEPHGRVLVVGGGLTGFGQLQIFDPLKLDPAAVAANPSDPHVRYAAFRGSTSIADVPADYSGTGTGAKEGPGTPKWVAPYSNDIRMDWIAGGPAPAGIIVSPTGASPVPPNTGDYTLAVSGSNVPKNHPVSLYDRTLGRFQRADAAADGTFLVGLSVRNGDRLELLENADSFAYVATPPIGIEAVDLNVVYNHPPVGPGDNSGLMGWYDGVNDPNLVLCGAPPVGGIGETVNGVATLFDAANPHPLVVASLMGNNGVLLLEAPVATPSALTYLSDICTDVQGNRQITGMAVVQQYAFDWNGNGVLDGNEQRDYIVATHRLGGVMIYDVTDRANPTLVGQIPLPGEAAHLGVDTANRVLYVAGYGGGVYVVDFNRKPSIGLLDKNLDGIDDRVLETIKLSGNTNAPVFVAPDLGLIYAGGLSRGVTSVAVGGPRLTALANNLDTPAGGKRGGTRQINAIAPFGVPSVAEPGNGQMRPGFVQVLANLPGGVGQQVALGMTSVDWTGAPAPAAGDCAPIQNLPPVKLDDVQFTRLSDQIYQEGYNLFLSEPLTVLADLKASSFYHRSADEDDHCTRCDLSKEQVPAGARELLSGATLKVSFPPALRDQLSPVYHSDQLDASELAVPSVRWELTPSPHQEPSQNAPAGVQLHSGEMTASGTDMTIAGRGMDFVFERAYRNQTVGDGPFGPGWDHNFNLRLRELPNGDIEYYDGRARREVYQKCTPDNPKCQPGPSGQAPPQYLAPTGVFSEMRKVSDGYVLIDSRHNLTQFDRGGRLTSLADAVKQDDSTGNQITLHYGASGRLDYITETLGRDINLTYDSHGHITQIEDFDGRDWTYQYDGSCRLISATTPPVLKALFAGGDGLTTSADGIATTYAYDPATGDLATTLGARGRMTSVTDGKGQGWLQVSYADQRGSGRNNEVATQNFGGGPVAYNYDFGGHTATVTDALQNQVQFTTTEAGQVSQITDPTGASVAYTYDEEGLVTSKTDPLGRSTSYTYDTPCTGQGSGDRRSRGNLTQARVIPDGRGPNGSTGPLVTCTDYESYSNQPVKIVDPRGAVTQITRNDVGLPTAVTRAAGAPEQSTTQTSYNQYGQPQQVINPDGHVTLYQYSGIGYLQNETVDRGGLNLSTSYETDDRGNVTAMVDARGVRHQRTYNALNWITSSTRAASPSLETPPAPALNYVTSYLYDANGNLVEEQKPIGDGSQYTRVRHIYGQLDELLVQAREVKPGDHWADWSKVSYAYDMNRNLVQTIEPDGQTTVVTYDRRNLPIARTRAFGSQPPFTPVTDTFQYDAERHLTLYTDGRQNGWTTSYDGYGRVAATVDPLGNRSRTTYDNGNNPVAATAFQPQPLGIPPGDQLLAQRNATYDLLGRRTALTAKLWSVYDLHNLGLPANARDLTTAVHYDPASNVTAVIDPLGRTTQYLYDAAERRIVTIDAAGNRLEHDLDADGNAVTTRSKEQFTGGGAAPGSTPVTVTTHATYDALDRLATTADGLGNTRSFSYDARNNLAFSADAEGNLTTQSWDGLDRLVQTVKPEGIEVDYGYDASSRLLSYADALGNQTSYAYDALNRRVSVTYPDHTTELTAYDANGNPQQIVDANGTQIVQQYDAANRMTGRSVQHAAAGVIGALSETYVYDGLHRLTHAQSGNQSTDLAFDSLSRRVQEAVGGKSVTYGFDDGGNETAIGYPSGYTAARAFDPLDRLLTVGQANGPTQSATLAGFGYRGPDLVASQSRANGIATVRQFDAAKRMVDDWWQLGVTGPSPQTVFRQGLGWSPRGLKSAQARADLGGSGLLFVYDKAERLAQAAKSSSQQLLTRNNVAFGASDLTGLPDAFGYTYDPAQNLLAASESKNGIPALTALPLDGSGRNRPGARNGVALQWDKNGNLTQKGNLGFRYDFRNRLVQVTDGSQGGAVVASYDYDVFNRRISKTVGTSSRLTVWQGWRPIEDYDISSAPHLLSRRTYGSGLDEILYLESDLDGTGNVTAKSWPLYDAEGNVALLTNAAGKPLERYDYTPYGTQKILVNSIPPAVQQVRVVGGALWVELSEAVLPGPLSPSSITFFDNTLQLPFTSFGVTQPVWAGDLAGRRVAITAAAPNGLQPGDQVTLTIPAAALVDTFLNQPAQDYSLTFSWPAGDAVVADLAAPTLQSVVLRQGSVEVELSSEPNLAAATAAIQVDGAPLAWTLAADHYTLRSTTPVAAGAHTVTIAATLTDLGGRPLAAAFSRSFTTTSPQDTQALFVAADPQQVNASTVGNLFGYQGLPRDPETGLLYFRNRYYDPELGRFITADPKGYVDGPSVYAFEMDDPANGSDPMGLCLGFGGGTCADVADRAAASLHKFKAKISADDSGVLGIVANTIAGTAVDAVETFVSQTMWRGVDCLSMPSYCAQDVKASVKDLPRQASQAKEDWENAPIEQHERAWGGALFTGFMAAVPGAQEAEFSTAAPALAPAPKGGVKPYEVDTYGNLQARSVPGKPLTRPHIRKAVRAEVERRALKTSTLTPAELAKVRDQGTAVAVPQDLHRSASPTYGGRNNPSQIAADAKTPKTAAARDSQAMVNAATDPNKAAARKAAATVRKKAEDL